MTPMRGLYPIVDLDSLATRRLGPLELAEAVLTARPHLLQLRAKHASPRDVLALLERLKPLCAKAGTLLFANDRPDLAILAGAEGVHVGQDDLPLEAVRRLPGALKVGISTHNAAQLAHALALAPDYVAFGPIFATRSKERPEPALGMQALLDAATLAARAQVPLVAIGGLELSAAEALGKAGVMAALISDLLLDGDTSSAVAARANAWQAALRQTQASPLARS
jgi:thiamine-phosphate pyrophosphorylase